MRIDVHALDCLLVMAMIGCSGGERLPTDSTLRIDPPTNTSNVDGLKLLLTSGGPVSLDWLEGNLEVVDGNGDVVATRLTREMHQDRFTSGDLHWSLDKIHVEILGDGLHRIRVPRRRDLRQPSLLPLRETATHFTADLLMGVSDPGIARVVQCWEVGENRLRVTYSERVNLPAAISESIVVRTNDGAEPSCAAFGITQADGSKAPQLSGVEFGMTCELEAGVAVGEIEVVSPPTTDAGVVASFPALNVPIAVDEWLPGGDGDPRADCKIWLPMRWDL